MKRLEIQWRHLDQGGKTCDRCSDTGENIRQAIGDMTGELAALSWQAVFVEIKLSESQIGDSNLVLFNDVAIEDLLDDAKSSMNCCTSCGEILGVPTRCRTIEYNGRSYDAIPAAVIREAAFNLVKRQTQ